MDAQLVWDTWRRILSNDQLVEWVLDPGSSGPDERTGLTAGELAVLTDYASTPAASDTNIGMYRRGLVRNALGALSLVRLTRRLLYTGTLDIEAVAGDFVQSTDYADHGPNFWRIAGDFIAYLATVPEFAAPVQQDVLALDAAAVTLARRLGESAVDVWPDSAATMFPEAAEDVSHGSTHFVASRAALVASSSYDLTPWIENPEDFDPDEQLKVSTRHWLIYFPSAEAEHAYAELSERTARTFNLLSTPHTSSDVSLALDGLPRAEAIEVIDSLAQLGVITIERDACVRG
jgi:hypothetical protein